VAGRLDEAQDVYTRQLEAMEDVMAGGAERIHKREGGAAGGRKEVGEMSAYDMLAAAHSHVHRWSVRLDDEDA
jgi:hypothetical protein